MRWPAGLAGTGSNCIEGHVHAPRLSSAARNRPRLVQAKCLLEDSRTIPPSVEKEPQDVSSYRVSRCSGSSAKLMLCRSPLSSWCSQVLFSSPRGCFRRLRRCRCLTKCLIISSSDKTSARTTGTNSSSVQSGGYGIGRADADLGNQTSCQEQDRA